MESKPPQDDLVKRIIKFQDEEISRFLREKINVRVLGDIGVIVDDSVLRSLREPTKKGILAGLEIYLKAKGREGKPLYPISFDDIPSQQRHYMIL
ncbi:hypothetical protein COV19_00230 [Candidatus Woesearchaeota archaeon CG10_big_fil_rev_8_21_14_0_10_44_13]|nr:MAG: hypothetical protein COV19_00230 [Candidatus Woesearchaeota archaeon CG10_big_fil_rev_8_21_14_0_10_44_13]